MGVFLGTLAAAGGLVAWSLIFGETTRGGSYIETALMPTVGERSRGSYMALVVHKNHPQNLQEAVRVLVGDTVLKPRGVEEYNTVENQFRDENSWETGGEGSVDQSVDSAWVAAQATVGNEVENVSYILVVESVDENSQIYKKYGMREDDRITSIEGGAASIENWEQYVEKGFSVHGSSVYGKTVELGWVGERGVRSETLIVSTNLRREPQMSGDALLMGGIGITVREIVAVRGERPALMVPENIKGGSAGILHTLLYVDHLTEGDLTGGMQIAGTGVVYANGRVGEIGGLERKLEAAEKNDADVVFIPRDNLFEVKHLFVGEGPLYRYNEMRVVVVSKVQEAVRWLCANGGESRACFNVWQYPDRILGIPSGFEHLAQQLEDRYLKMQQENRFSSGPK